MSANAWSAVPPAKRRKQRPPERPRDRRLSRSGRTKEVDAHKVYRRFCWESQGKQRRGKKQRDGCSHSHEEVGEQTHRRTVLVPLTYFRAFDIGVATSKWCRDDARNFAGDDPRNDANTTSRSTSSLPRCSKRLTYMDYTSGSLGKS